MDRIYYEIMHSDYYWGIYGLTDLTGWEDVKLYKKVNDQYEYIGSFCLCSKNYHLAHIEESRIDCFGSPDWLNEVETFLAGNKVHYYYYYDKKEDIDFFEVPFEAQRNILGIKPSSIEIWHPRSGIDEIAINDALMCFGHQFLKIDNVTFIEKNPTSKKDAAKSYLEEYDLMTRSKGIIIEADIVTQFASKVDLPENEAREIMKRSIKF